MLFTISLKFKVDDVLVPDCITCTETGLALPAVTVMVAERCAVPVLTPVGVIRSEFPD